LAVGLLASHYSLAWLVLGVAVGMIMGAVLARPGQTQQGSAPLKPALEINRASGESKG
jgi:hypothetical protein